MKLLNIQMQLDRRCSNYIFILDLTPGFNGLGKDNCKTSQETSMFSDLMWPILEVWRYILNEYFTIFF